MEPILTAHEIKKTNFLTKFTLVLFGILVTSIIFAFTVKIFQIPGIWIGLVLCAIIIGLTLKYKAPGSHLRMIAWSMLATIIAFTIIYFVGLGYVQNTLQGFETK
jgi:hypothetical protein